MNEKRLIAPTDRIPLVQKLAFSAGGSVDFFATGLMLGIMWMPYFNIGLGMSPAKLGMILMIFQAWNAVLDPIMGNVSDNARTRWGRRRPFLVVGALLTGIVSPWLWRPPVHWGETGMVIYLLAVGMVFYACFACWAMPYYGLQLELTPNYDERTRLTAWMTFFSKLTGLLGGWAMAIFASPMFADPLTGKPDIVHGMKTCSWFIGLLIIIFGMLPALFVRERYYETETRNQKRDPFWRSIRESASCHPLWMLIGLSFFLVVGSYSVNSLGQYVNIYYVCHGDLAAASVIAGWKGTVLVVTGILCIPLYTWLGERFDKKLVVAFMLLGTMFGHLLNLFLMTPAMPYLQIIPGIFESCAMAAVWLFIPSMKADVADYDEGHTERRREGSLNAFFSWFIKAALTCSMGLGGLVLSISGFDVKRTVEQPPDVLHSMLLLYVSLPLIIWGCGLIFIWLYPLDRARMGRIRTELEARRGAL